MLAPKSVSGNSQGTIMAGPNRPTNSSSKLSLRSPIADFRRVLTSYQTAQGSYAQRKNQFALN